MRLEFEIKPKKIAAILVIGLVGLSIGYVLGAMLPADNQGACLTSADLNRTDLGNISVITAQQSRFCEGLGFVSAVRWQQDEQGNLVGTPICLRP